MPITIARRLKIARLQADLTQVQAAELVGLERNTISRYEAALRSPSALNLKRLARAYGKTLDWLCNEEDPSGYQEEPHPNEEPTPKEDATQAILAADDSELVQICQRRRQIGPLGRCNGVPLRCNELSAMSAPSVQGNGHAWRLWQTSGAGGSRGLPVWAKSRQAHPEVVRRRFPDCA